MAAGKGVCAQSFLIGELEQEMFGQFGDVARTFAKRRHPQRDNLQP